MSSLIGGLLPIWFTPEAIAEDTPAVRYVRETLTRCSGEGYALACEALAAADLREDAKRIKAPTLVVCGDEDIPSFLAAARWLAANIADATSAWIPRSRHASVLERPDEGLKLLREFLRSFQPRCCPLVSQSRILHAAAQSKQRQPRMRRHRGEMQ